METLEKEETQMGKTKTNYNKISEEVKEEKVEVVEEVTEVVEEAKPENKKGVVSNCECLKVRKEASTKTDNVITIIDAKTEVEILDESKKGWYKITTKGGVTGFCMKDYITVK